MIRASIDIGSNTTLLLLGTVSGVNFNELENESRVTSLGKSVDVNKAFLEQSMNETFKALSEYCEIIRKYNIEAKDVVVTATEASRVASNSSLFYKKVKSELGLNVDIINSIGEAFYTAFGVVSGTQIQSDKITIMDIGGASTELIKVIRNPFKIESSISLPIGSVRATDWLKDDIFDSKIKDAFGQFDLTSYQTDHLICVAGSMTSLGAMIGGLKEYDSSKVNGIKLSYADFLKFYKKLSQINEDQISQKYPFLGKRSASIFGGACVGKAVAESLGVQSFEISTLGLRYGTIRLGEIDERYLK